MNEDKATRYHRLTRRAGILSLVWGIAMLVGVLATPLNDALGTLSESAASGAQGWRLPLTVVYYVLGLSLLHEFGSLPIAFYSGFVLERRYGLSNERLGGWVKDQVKSLAISLALGTSAASLIYLLIRRFPDGWWLPAGAVFALLMVGLTNLAPVVLLPLFYRIRPLDRESLRARLLALADRAGARVLGAYEWGMSDKTRKANAALAGLGGTRRILVSDTMLDEYSDDEIEVVLAHELAHHVHGDIWKGLLFETALIFGGFFLAAKVLRQFVQPLGLSGPSDVAGLPLLLLAAGALSLFFLPAAHALSRRLERGADRFALELTRNPAAFVSAMRRLAAQNLAEERPSRMTRWLFYSHPPISERIEAAQKLLADSR